MDDFLITFQMAAANIGDKDVLIEPGFAGLQMLLEVHHADLIISKEVIEEAFKANEWPAAHSFSWDDFKKLVCHVYSLEDTETSVLAIDDESKDLADFVDVIADRNASQIVSSIPPSIAETTDATMGSEDALLLVDTVEAVELQSFIEYQKQQYFTSNHGVDHIPQAVQMAAWNRRYYNVWLRRFLFNKSLSTKKFAHKMAGDHFISLIPPSSIADETFREESVSLIANMTTNVIVFLDQELWASWDVLATAVEYSDKDAIDMFEMFLIDEYFNIMRHVLSSSNSNTHFTPKVLPETDATEYVACERRQLLKKVSAEVNEMALQAVSAQWRNLLQTSPASVRVLLGPEPSNKFWKQHYYPALFDAYDKNCNSLSSVLPELASVLPSQSSGLCLPHSVQSWTPHSVQSSRPSRLLTGIPNLASDVLHSPAEQSRDASIGDAGIAALMSGSGYNAIQISDEVLQFMSSRAIIEEGVVGSKCMFEGALLHWDEEARSVTARDQSASPTKRKRNDYSVLDVLMIDRTGPMQATLFGDELVADFLQEVSRNPNKTKIVSFTEARIVEYQKNEWNGTILTSMRMLHSISSIANRHGTVVSIIDTASSPSMLSGSFAVPAKDACITRFETIRSKMLAPFRGTFKGTITDLEAADVTQQGTPKRRFKLVDEVGAYVNCCALLHNAASQGLTAKQDVVIYFATGRAAIGSLPGMLYLMKDAVIVPLQVQMLPPVKRVHVEIRSM